MKSKICRYTKLISIVFIFSIHTIQLVSQSPELKIQVCHQKPVTTLCVSDDNNFAATGAMDYLLKMWDLNTGKVIRTFTGHKHFVTSAFFSRNNKLLVSADVEGKIYAWDIASGKIIQQFQEHQSGIRSLTLHPKGKLFASADSAKQIIIWSLAEGKLVKKIPTNSVIQDIYFLADGKSIAFADENGEIQMLDIVSGNNIKKFTGNKSKGIEIRTNNTDSSIAILDTDGKIILWGIDSGKITQKFQSVSSRYTSFDFIPDSSQIIISSSTNEIEIFDIESGDLIKSIHADEKVSKLKITPNGKQLVSVQGRSICLYALPQLQKSTYTTDNSVIINQILANKLNNVISICGKKNELNHIQQNTGKALGTYFSHDNYVECIAYDPKFENLASGSRDKTIKIWDAATHAVKGTLKGHEDVVSTIDYRNDGLYLVSGGWDKTVKLWDVNTGEIVRSFDRHRDKVLSVSFSKDGLYIASGGLYDKQVKIWDIEKNKLHENLYGHQGDIWAVKFSPTDSILATGSSDNTIILWDTKTWKRIAVLKAHTDIVKTIEFSSDGKFLASGSWDKQIIIWDIKTLQPVKYLKGHRNHIRSVQFVCNDTLLISGGADTQIKLWDINTGEELLTTLFFKNSKDFVVTSPQGYFDGNNTGIKKALHYVQGTTVIPLGAFYEKFHIPGLWKLIMNGKKIEKPQIDLTKQIKMPPLIEFVSPGPSHLPQGMSYNNGIFHSGLNIVEISLKATDMGGGIDEICLYHNNKLIETTQRGFKPLVHQGETKQKTFQVLLLPGINIFQAKAFNTDRTESVATEIKIYFKGQPAASDLYIMAIGVNAYKNTVMNLNYARTDMDTFVHYLNSGARQIFNNIYITRLLDNNVTRQNILHSFDTLKQQIRPNDVFVFYYAGHGVVSDEDKLAGPDFYIVPHDVTQIYGDLDQLNEKALSAHELKEHLRFIRAQKQLIILDACHSGGAIKQFATRGMAEQKAIIQLARSTGVTMIAASGTEQFATEFETIGHGVFTYAILEAMKGKADSGNKDGKITVNEIKAYIEDRVPELTEQYKGQAQYPTGYSHGQDFPVVTIQY